MLGLMLGEDLISNVPHVLTPKCQELVLVSEIFTNPVPALQVRDIAVRDMSEWELMEHLAAAGWAVKVRGAKKSRRAMPYEAPDGRKEWYVKSTCKVSRYYLLALALVHEHQLPVPHGAADKVYLEILGIKLPGREKDG